MTTADGTELYVDMLSRDIRDIQDHLDSLPLAEAEGQVAQWLTLIQGRLCDDYERATGRSFF